MSPLKLRTPELVAVLKLFGKAVHGKLRHRQRPL